jgi:hypothetical protein
VKYVYVVILLIIGLPLLGRTKLVQIDNRTNFPFVLSADGNVRKISIAPNSITPLYKWVKLSHAIDKESYQPWYLTQADTNHKFSIVYHGLRYDLCGMRARWHEKGPYYVAAQRNNDRKHYDECVVGPRDTSLSITIHERDGLPELCLMPGDQYTRILR